MSAPARGAGVETLFATLAAFNRVQTEASPDGSVVDLDGGVTAFVVPSAPTQSILNCVVHDDRAALAAALPRLAALYRDAGVGSWMVWTLPGDARAPRLLREAGHLLEYEPMAMSLSLAELRAPGEGPPVAIDRDAHPLEITTLNEHANGEPPGAFGTAFAGLRERCFHRWAALLDGRPVACAVTWDHGDNCMVQWVATDPGAQRRGVAGRLLHAALLAARERGMRTSTLESSYEGERLYERLGYAPLGRLGMWLGGEPAPRLS